MSEGDEHEPESRGLRKIIHVDMDAFFASVEQRDNPELRGKPVAVGGSSGRGVVAAASYEARRFGVRSAMPSVTARRLCPELIFCKGRFEAYREVSRQIRSVFRHYTDLVEPLSLDEAYLDVTEDKLGIGSATRIAELIRQEIRAKTMLTASAGVSYNKFLAKLASDQNKPDGLCVIRPGEGAGFVASLPVRRFHGVGPRGRRRWRSSGSRPAPISPRRTSPGCARTSAASPITSIAPRGGSTCGRFGRAASASRWAGSARSPRIFPAGRRCARRSRASSTSSGALSTGPARAGAP
jgi:DNA polymerase IV